MSLVVMDSVRIQESDRQYVGEPNAIAVGNDGSVFISDVRERKVVRVSRDGSHTDLVAGRGGGPREVSPPTSFAVLGDSLLVVQNAGRKRLELFALQPLQCRETVTMLRPTGNISSAGNGVLASSLMPDSGTAFVELSNAYAVVRSGGIVPELYRRSPPVAQAFGATVVARDGDHVVGAVRACGVV